MKELLYLKDHQLKEFIEKKIARRMKGNQKLECELTLKGGKVVYDLNGLASIYWK